ncbi:MAG: hypothetical protein KJZ98_09725 [Burkholderiaceae bacterium]|nr:hypothetical protein [Burkholderiaceae bacterium]MEB2351274.1 hypothetical protein [Burkholderiaceae bacterium]
MTVCFAPAVDHAEALASYPTAIAAEPVPESQAGALPADLVALFDDCERAGLYDADDRAALLAMFALDAEGTHGLVEAMHARFGRCRRCTHFRRPGLSDGYCTACDDLPGVYGFLRAPPGDEGATCATFADREQS